MPKNSDSIHTKNFLKIISRITLLIITLSIGIPKKSNAIANLDVVNYGEIKNRDNITYQNISNNHTPTIKNKCYRVANESIRSYSPEKISALDKKGKTHVFQRFVNTGLGCPFSNINEYRAIRRASEQKRNYPIQWQLSELRITGPKLIGQSKNPGKEYYGASVLKLFLAIAFADKYNGMLSWHNLQKMYLMFKISDNAAWKYFKLTWGSDSKGLKAIKDYSIQKSRSRKKKINGRYEITDRGQGITVRGTNLFLSDLFYRRDRAARIVRTFMYSINTGKGMIDYYLPANVAIAGKSGTFSRKKWKKNYTNHATVFKFNGKTYALSIFTEGDYARYGTPKEIREKKERKRKMALLAGGLFQEEILGLSYIANR